MSPQLTNTLINDIYPLTCGDRVISVWLGQYHGCWCPGSLRRQDISSHDIDYVEYVGPGLTWEWILSSCVISMWSNDIKCKYMFMFPLNNLARKEDCDLTHTYITGQIHLFTICVSVVAGIEPPKFLVLAALDPVQMTFQWRSRVFIIRPIAGVAWPYCAYDFVIYCSSTRQQQQ